MMSFSQRLQSSSSSTVLGWKLVKWSAWWRYHVRSLRMPSPSGFANAWCISASDCRSCAKGGASWMSGIMSGSGSSGPSCWSRRAGLSKWWSVILYWEIASLSAVVPLSMAVCGLQLRAGPPSCQGRTWNLLSFMSATFGQPLQGVDLPSKKAAGRLKVWACLSPSNQMCKSVFSAKPTCRDDFSFLDGGRAKCPLGRTWGQDRAMSKASFCAFSLAPHSQRKVSSLMMEWLHLSACVAGRSETSGCRLWHHKVVHNQPSWNARQLLPRFWMRPTEGVWPPSLRSESTLWLWRAVEERLKAIGCFL